MNPIPAAGSCPTARFAVKAIALTRFPRASLDNAGQSVCTLPRRARSGAAVRLPGWRTMPAWAAAFVVAAVAVCGAAIAATASAAVDPFVFDVNSSADEPDADAGDGLCKTAANTCTLRAAVMQANVVPNVNSTINVPAGTYKLGLPIDPNKGSLKLTTPTGGNPVISIVGAGAAVTTIDGNLTDRVLRVYLGRTANVSGVSLVNGEVSQASGGAVYNDGVLYMTDATISNSQALDAYGGGIYNTAIGGSYLSLLRVKIDANAASIGGGIYNSGILIVSHSVILDNVSTVQAGGIYSSTNLAVTFSTISGNLTVNYGGAIATSGDGATTLTLSHSTLDGNSAIQGGALYLPFGTAYLDHDTLSRNTAQFGGGVKSNGSLIMSNSTISQNASSNTGGGIYNVGSANVYNSTIAYNEADSDADGTGDGAGVFNETLSTFNLRNSVLAGNYLAGQQDYHDCFGIVGFYGHNRISAMSGCSIAPGSPGTVTPIGSLDELGILEDNGGPTQTIALVAPSSMIGGAVLCTNQNAAALATDQRDRQRPTGTTCDIGAFEYNELFRSAFEATP